MNQRYELLGLSSRVRHFKYGLSVYRRFSHTDASAYRRIENCFAAEPGFKHLVNLAVQYCRPVVVSKKNAGQAQARIISFLDLRDCSHKQFKALQIVAGRKHRDDEPVRSFSVCILLIPMLAKRIVEGDVGSSMLTVLGTAAALGHAMAGRRRENSPSIRSWALAAEDHAAELITQTLGCIGVGLVAEAPG